MIFSNDFRITEATDYAGLIFKNQLGTEILNMNENGDLDVANDILVQDLQVAGNTTIAGELTVTKAVSFTDTLTVTKKATFDSDIELKGHLIGNHDTSGTLSIPAGQTELTFTFDSQYLSEPNITATQKITCSTTTNEDGTSTKTCGNINDVNYALEVYLDKFIIHLKEAQTTDITFMWQAEQ